MESDRSTVHQLFKPERQYCVPFYQRAYVWNLEDQWERLWSDIQEKAEARIEGLKITPHFMGAVVLDPQERKKLIGVEKVHIIDGQQRMTTLQFVLTALTIVLREWKCEELLPPIQACVRNSDEKNMRDKVIEPFKLWPTFSDRQAYGKATAAVKLDDLRRDFSDHFTQQGTLKKVGIPHPPSLEAIWYFADQMSTWAKKQKGDASANAEALAEAILEDLVLIAITLEEDDDAQVIFETLNGHGVELTASDLIRNYIFLKADAEGADCARLYDDYWKHYEAPMWKREERRGRLVRPRLEWFVQSVLQAESRDEVDQGRIYAEYQRYTRSVAITANDQLRTLASYAGAYEALLGGTTSTPVGRFGKRFSSWDASTTYALALAIARSSAGDREQEAMFSLLGSYIVRRAICGLTNKNYNKVFLQFLKGLGREALTLERFHGALEAPRGDATRWPRDDEFKRGFMYGRLYPGNAQLDSGKLKSILTELENGLRSARSEEPVVLTLDPLDIDHMMPREWYAHWALPDGSTCSKEETWSALLVPATAGTLTQRQAVIQKREAAVPTLGNLTLLHYGTNRAAQNHAFKVKQEMFLKHSNLHLNRDLMTASAWDEGAIQTRAELLFEVAVRVWPGPQKAA
jgi:hypothetical protein